MQTLRCRVTLCNEVIELSVRKKKETKKHWIRTDGRRNVVENCHQALKRKHIHKALMCQGAVWAANFGQPYQQLQGKHALYEANLLIPTEWAWAAKFGLINPQSCC